VNVSEVMREHGSHTMPTGAEARRHLRGVPSERNGRNRKALRSHFMKKMAASCAPHLVAGHP